MSQELMLQVMAAFNGKAYVHEMALVVRYLGYSYKQSKYVSSLVSDRLHRLRKWGLVTEDKNGLWSLTPDGIAEVKNVFGVTV